MILQGSSRVSSQLGWVQNVIAREIWNGIASIPWILKNSADKFILLQLEIRYFSVTNVKATILSVCLQVNQIRLSDHIFFEHLSLQLMYTEQELSWGAVWWKKDESFNNKQLKIKVIKFKFIHVAQIKSTVTCHNEHTYKSFFWFEGYS